MKDILIQKLHQQLVDNYPDLLLSLQEENKVSEFLDKHLANLDDLPDRLLAEGKPPYIVEELCMDAFSQCLGPSKYNFLCSILLEDFEQQQADWIEQGILVYEVVNIIQTCGDLLADGELTEERKDDPDYRAAISEKIREYTTRE